MLDYTHLHCHSDFSILDASISIPALVSEVKAKGMKSLALTDHGNIHGLIHFYQECKKQGIKPILGCELYVARRSAKEKADKVGGNPSDHLVVLARDNEGYQNLLRLVSWSCQYGFHGTPRVDLQKLAEHSKGLIGLTACLSGAVQRLTNGWRAWDPHRRVDVQIAPDPVGAEKMAAQLGDIFGRGNFFLEIQRHVGAGQDADLVSRQERCEAGNYEISRRLGLPLVCTNDIHFKTREDAPAREIAYMIARGGVEKSRGAEAISHDGEFFVKSPDEMLAAFQGRDSSLFLNTQWIAEQCNVELEIGKNHFARPVGDSGEMNDEEMQATWERLIEEGFQVRYAGKGHEQEARDRIAYEKGVIEKMGFVPYFLVVADFVRYAKRNGIPVGPGRGSVGGCAIAYILRITNVDPIRHGLLFERFLNPDRVSMPDMDIDFCKDRVSEVVNYVAARYGHDRVARITTFGNMWAKSVFRDVGRVLEVPQDRIDLICSNFPQSQGEFRMTVGKAIEEIPEIQELANSPDERERRLLEFAKRLEGIKRSVSTHACGVVIGDHSLEDYTALMPVKEDDFGGILQSQFDMSSLETLGLLKYDFLALDTLTTIERAQVWARKRGKACRIEDDEECDDKLTYELIRRGQTMGAFQIETGGMRELVIQVAPQTIEDLAVVVALYRPGPLDAVDAQGLTMVDHYVRRRWGQEPVVYAHPCFKPILEKTFGIIVFQEQVMQISRALCGYTPGQSDNLRKAIGKKKPEAIAKEKERFIKGAVEHSKTSQEDAEAIWHTIETFARYGFNKSHALAYGVVTYQTMWLKAHLPVEFMASTLTSAAGIVPEELQDQSDRKSKSDIKVAKYIDECNRLGIPVLPPDVNLSQDMFLPVGESIRAGLGAVLGVGGDSGRVISARGQAGGAFQSYRDFINFSVMAGVTKGTLEALIRCGAADDLGERNQMLVVLEDSMKAAKESFDLSLPAFVAMPQSMPQVRPMAEESLRAYSLEALGAYNVPQGEPNRVGISCSEIPQVDQVLGILMRHPGKIPVSLSLTVGEKILDFSLGSFSGSKEAIEEIRAVASVKEV